MTEHYVEKKIDEALKATDGNEKDAAKLLITWAVRDQALLLGMTKPEMKDVALRRIHEHLRSGKKDPAHHAHSPAKDAIVFGGKGDKRHPSSKVPPPKSSERQATVMHQLVNAFKKKK